MSVIQITENDFEEKIKNSTKKVIVDCYADWCGPCKMLAPIMDEVSNENDLCDFYKLNVDSAAEIAIKYDIMSIPTILIFKDGKLIDRSVGLLSKDELEELIK